ncbi:kinase-like domain-containing protein [Aspergillus floccosus]
MTGLYASPCTTNGNGESDQAGLVSPPDSPHLGPRSSRILPDLTQQLQVHLGKGGSKTVTKSQAQTAQEGGPSDKHLGLGKKRTQSQAGISEVVARKLSVTFGNPTVIHRSHLRSRPSVRAVPFHETPNASLGKQGDSANDSSNHSSTLPTTSGSPVSARSTPPTSAMPSTPLLTANAPTKPPVEEHDGHEPQRISLSQDEKRRERPPDTVSSIVTVENTANAKVFFEKYFDAVYSGADPRTQRQRELEEYLYALPLGPEERSRVWRNWIVQEREYLRQCRVLNACSRGSHLHNPTMAGFEIIKVLGRGSFGVVRLVREKSQTSSRDNPTKFSRDWSIQGRRRVMAGVKKDVFAMKVIRKSAMIRNCQEAHLRAERDFLVASAKSHWIVPLIASFQDDNFLYLIMDYMVGGDFLGLLMRRCILPESAARWYVAEMILCIEEAHRLCWIHRDVKPDNFLISASGHLKISDFGLAFNGHWAHDQMYYNNHRYSLVERLGIKIHGDTKDQKEEKRTATSSQQTPYEVSPSCSPPSFGVLEWRDQNERRRFAQSIVGTSQYMAPEVVRGQSYDGRCDWWSVGIILYECLYGFTPFASKERHETKLKIHHHLKTLHFPAQRTSDKLVSAEAIDLITDLLHEKEFRLSCEKYRESNDLQSELKHFVCNSDAHGLNPQGFYVYPDDAADIKAHPFFRDIRWEDLHKSSPPFIPKVRGWEDTRYFDDGDPCDEKDGMHISSESGWSEGTEESSRDGDSQREPQRQPENEGWATKPTPTKLKLAAKDVRDKGARRPRDKLLRDKQVGKTVLEIRKKGTFVGYTYRRPKPVAMAFAPERGRSPFAPGDAFELYG